METKDPLRILFAEDVATDKEIAEREIKNNKINVVSALVDTEAEFRIELEKFSPDIVISDYSMPRFDGMSALKITREKDPYMPFLLLTGSNNEETAVNCMKAGADDYILKDNMHRLVPAIESAIKKCNALKLKEQTEKKLSESESRFSTIFDVNPVAMALTLQENDKIIDVNNAYIQMTGYSRSEIIGKTGFDLNLWVNPEQRSEFTHKVYLTGRTAGEVQIRRKNGEVIFLLMDINTLEVNRQKCFLFIGQNISELKQTEEQLREKMDELERFNTLMVGRELKMIELKKEINALLDKIGEHPKYDVDFKV